MTNKVKPFYILITDDMTPQMVQDVFDKCVDAGAKLDEGCRGVKSKHEYKKQYNPSNFKFFGVDDSFMTYMDIDLEYFTDAQEITLDQLDEWLGLEAKLDWKNGDECEHGHHDYSGANKMTYIGAHPFISGKHVCLSELKGIVIVDSIWLRKPETPEQKAEREKRDEAKEMIKCLLDNHTKCEESAIEYVIDYLKECESLGR